MVFINLPVADLDRAVAFYEALGFEETGRIPIRDEAINVFMNLPGDGESPRLELTYNIGVDSYEIGTGYGHIAVTTADLDGTLSELAEQGITPEKPPYTVSAGGSRICFVRDPDGYRIEGSNGYGSPGERVRLEEGGATLRYGASAYERFDELPERGDGG